jgi:hypothetical protein
MRSLTRRSLTFALGAIALALTKRDAAAAPRIVVKKDPTCGCCSAWVEHVAAQASKPTSTNSVTWRRSRSVSRSRPL